MSANSTTRGKENQDGHKTSPERRRQEYMKSELTRLEKQLNEERAKIVPPEKKEHTPNTFNSLDPYTNTRTPHMLIFQEEEKVRLKTRELAVSRPTAVGLTDPWIDWKMDNPDKDETPTSPRSSIVLTDLEKKSPRTSNTQPEQRRSQLSKQGSTRLPQYPRIRPVKNEIPDKQIPFSEVADLRKELSEQYNYNSPQKISKDYERTKQDFYRMELDKLDEIHPINKEHMRSAYFAYLNSIGARKALNECMKEVDDASEEAQEDSSKEHGGAKLETTKHVEDILSVQ